MSASDSEYSVGRKLQGDFAAFCDKAAELFEPHDFLKDAAAEMRELSRRVIHPFNIAVFGRMKTGKSTLINALVGRSLAVTGVEEATATINVLTHSETPGSFVAHWKDSPPETFPIASLQSDWNGKTDEVLDRVKRVSYLELFSDAESLKLCEITDTPGTGSEESVHEDVTQNFLAATEKQGRHADAIVYVFPPVGRESDLDNLENYRKNNCLPNSDPYNSVAVLHKWDHIFWENGGDMEDIRAKAGRLKEVMKAMVADVIPVSAPLALAAVEAPDAFWEKALEICRSMEWNELGHLLSRDGKWDRDDARHAFRHSYALPWPSFQIILREIARNKDCCSDVATARRRIYDLSGLKNFKSFLDSNFFKRGELIRQKQTYNEILRIKDSAYQLIERRRTKLKTDRKAWDELFSDAHYDGSPFMSTWISQSRSACIDEESSLTAAYTEIDRAFINSAIEERIKDADTLERIEDCSAFSADEIRTLRLAFARLSELDECRISETEQLFIYELYEKAAKLSQHINGDVRKCASWIAERLSLLLK